MIVYSFSNLVHFPKKVSSSNSRVFVVPDWEENAPFYLRISASSPQPSLGMSAKLQDATIPQIFAILIVLSDITVSCIPLEVPIHMVKAAD
jgi:hypothetical protein